MAAPATETAPEPWFLETGPAPLAGRLCLSVLDTLPEAPNHRRFRSRVRSFHDDGMRFQDPDCIDRERVRWTVATDGLVLVSITPWPAAGGELWLLWQHHRLVPTTEAYAMSWTPGDAPGLPQLVGTEGQIAWALRIRASFARLYPNHRGPLKHAEADWWIRQRHILGVKED